MKIWKSDKQVKHGINTSEIRLRDCDSKRKAKVDKLIKSLKGEVLS